MKEDPLEQIAHVGWKVYGSPLALLGGLLADEAKRLPGIKAEAVREFSQWLAKGDGMADCPAWLLQKAEEWIKNAAISDDRSGSVRQRSDTGRPYPLE